MSGPTYHEAPAGGRFTRWVIVISGFTQHLGRPNGSEALFNRLWPLADRDTCVLMKAWHDDFRALAEFMHRNSDHARRPRVEVFAYSWGGGYGFPWLAREMARRGMVVRYAVLCDPVWRWGLLPPWLPANPLSLMSWPTITVPANVREVDWFYQRRRRPMAHQPIAADPDATAVNYGYELMAEHQWMDDHWRYHRRALEVAGFTDLEIERQGCRCVQPHD